MSKGCGSMKRCIRGPSSRSAGGAAEPERRPAAPGGAMEVRLQRHQVHRPDPLRREATADVMDDQLARNYGFYSNVNPTVNHPRHSQATEARLPSLFRSTRTQMFNG